MIPWWKVKNSPHPVSVEYSPTRGIILRCYLPVEGSIGREFSATAPAEDLPQILQSLFEDFEETIQLWTDYTGATWAEVSSRKPQPGSESSLPRLSISLSDLDL